MSLELRRAGYRWPGGAIALDEATIRLEPGRVLAILGPNGAGKSTLLGLASGRLEPAGGEALLEGKAIGAWDRRALARRLAHLPQVERLAFNYPVLDFVLLGRAPHVPSLAQPGPADLERAAAALAELGLSSLAERPVSELSGGELQLVRLARCLAQEAAYLLLDEPSTMLDPANARRLADELKRLAAGGRAIAFSTHDAAFASYAATEAVLLRSGEILACGPASAVLVPDLLEAAFGLPFKNAYMPSAFGA